MKSYTYLKTQLLGELLLVANATHLVGIYFANHKHAMCRDDWKLNPKHPVLRQACEEIQEYLNGKRTAFSVPFSFEGTEFPAGNLAANRVDSVWRNHQLQRTGPARKSHLRPFARRERPPEEIHWELSFRAIA